MDFQRVVSQEEYRVRKTSYRSYKYKCTQDKHNHVDDYPYGGGAGMVMQAQPVYDAYTALVERSLAENHGSYI